MSSRACLDVKGGSPRTYYAGDEAAFRATSLSTSSQAIFARRGPASCTIVVSRIPGGPAMPDLPSVASAGSPARGRDDAFRPQCRSDGSGRTEVTGCDVPRQGELWSETSSRGRCASSGVLASLLARAHTSSATELSPSPGEERLPLTWHSRVHTQVGTQALRARRSRTAEPGQRTPLSPPRAPSELQGLDRPHRCPPFAVPARPTQPPRSRLRPPRSCSAPPNR